MGHGIRLLAQFEQAAGHSPGDIEECQVADLAGGVAQALGDLAAEYVQNVRVLLGQLTEFRIADLRDLAFDLGPYPGAALLLMSGLFEQAQLAEKSPALR